MQRGIPEEVTNAIHIFLELLSKRFKIERAYLFGSYARGTWLKTSDIDLVVVSPDFRGIPYHKRLEIAYEIQWRAGIRPFIEIIPLTPEELERKLRESAVIRDASRYWIRIL